MNSESTSASNGTRRFWSDNAALGTATVLAGIFNTAYSVLLAHALGPVDYGRIGALNNLVSLFLLPLPIVGLAAIRLGRQRGREKALRRASLGIGLGIFILAALFSPALAERFRLAAVLVVLYSATVVLNFGYALYVGYLKRARRYGQVGLVLVLASGTSVLGVVLAVTVGRAAPLVWLGVWQLVTVVGLFFYTQFLAKNVPSLPAVRLRPEVVATTLGVGTLQALWGFSDVLFAKARLSSVQAGWYTGLSTIGQALPFVAASLATVMLTAVLDDPSSRRAYLQRTVWATGGLGALFIALLWFFPVPVVRLALGGAFVPMSPLIQRYSDAMAAMALVLVLTTYGVALGAYRTMVAAALGTALWIGALTGAHSMNALVNRTLESMLATLVLVVLSFWVGREISRPPHEGEDRLTAKGASS